MTHKRKRIFAAALLVATLWLTTAGQNKPRIDPLSDMVATERAFSRMSEEKGIPEAFTAFIAEDGILFRPRAVFGKKWMKEHPPPASTTRPLLVWQPILAGISRAGDLGYSTGPWRLKNDIKDANFSGFGNFMTVWKKQPDGKWRFVVDLGIRNFDPKTEAKLVFVRPPRESFRRVDTAKSVANLLNVERDFSKASAERGAVESFLAYAANDVRVFRNPHQPFTGRRAALQTLPPLNVAWTWITSAGDVSISGDLGYSYGIYELKNKATGEISETGNYLRVWRKIGAKWKMIIDVADPLPPEKKS